MLDPCTEPVICSEGIYFKVEDEFIPIDSSCDFTEATWRIKEEFSPTIEDDIITGKENPSLHIINSEMGEMKTEEVCGELMEGECMETNISGRAASNSILQMEEDIKEEGEVASQTSVDSCFTDSSGNQTVFNYDGKLFQTGMKCEEAWGNESNYKVCSFPSYRKSVILHDRSRSGADKPNWSENFFDPSLIKLVDVSVLLKNMSQKNSEDDSQETTLKGSSKVKSSRNLKDSKEVNLSKNNTKSGCHPKKNLEKSISRDRKLSTIAASCRKKAVPFKSKDFKDFKEVKSIEISTKSSCNSETNSVETIIKNRKGSTVPASCKQSLMPHKSKDFKEFKVVKSSKENTKSSQYSKKNLAELTSRNQKSRRKNTISSDHSQKIPVESVSKKRKGSISPSSCRQSVVPFKSKGFKELKVSKNNTKSGCHPKKNLEKSISRDRKLSTIAASCRKKAVPFKSKDFKEVKSIEISTKSSCNSETNSVETIIKNRKGSTVPASCKQSLMPHKSKDFKEFKVVKSSKENTKSSQYSKKNLAELTSRITKSGHHSQKNLADSVRKIQRHRLCPSVCRHCAAPFETNVTLCLEVQSTKKPSCTCSATLKTKQELGHCLVSQSNERPFSCMLCPSTFKTKAQVKQHLAVHSNEWPLSCAHCPAQFKRKAELNRHSVVHLKKKFSCSYCADKFLTKTELRRHAISHREKKPVFHEKKTVQHLSPSKKSHNIQTRNGAVTKTWTASCQVKGSSQSTSHGKDKAIFGAKQTVQTCLKLNRESNNIQTKNRPSRVLMKTRATDHQLEDSSNLTSYQRKKLFHHAKGTVLQRLNPSEEVCKIQVRNRPLPAVMKIRMMDHQVEDLSRPTHSSLPNKELRKNSAHSKVNPLTSPHGSTELQPTSEFEEHQVCLNENSLVSAAFTTQFENQSEPERHSIVHPNAKLLPCRYCDAKFPTTSELRKHIGAHLNDKLLAHAKEAEQSCLKTKREEILKRNPQVLNVTETHNECLQVEEPSQLTDNGMPKEDLGHSLVAVEEPLSSSQDQSQSGLNGLLKGGLGQNSVIFQTDKTSCQQDSPRSTIDSLSKKELRQNLVFNSKKKWLTGPQDPSQLTQNSVPKRELRQNCVVFSKEGSVSCLQDQPQSILCSTPKGGLGQNSVVSLTKKLLFGPQDLPQSVDSNRLQGEPALNSLIRSTKRLLSCPQDSPQSTPSSTQKGKFGQNSVVLSTEESSSRLQDPPLSILSSRSKGELRSNSVASATDKLISGTHCVATFKGGEEGDQHVSVHSNMINCSDCSAQFRNPKDLIRHSISHLPVERLSCPYCAAKFKTSLELGHHVGAHVNKLLADEEQAELLCKRTSSESEDIQTRNCQVPSTMKTDQTDIQVRNKEESMDSSLPKEELCQTSVVDLIKKPCCSHCGAQLKSQHEVNQHIFVHLRAKQLCPYCHAKFKTTSELTQHISAHKSKELLTNAKQIVLSHSMNKESKTFQMRKPTVRSAVEPHTQVTNSSSLRFRSLPLDTLSQGSVVHSRESKNIQTRNPNVKIDKTTPQVKNLTLSNFSSQPLDKHIHSKESKDIPLKNSYIYVVMKTNKTSSQVENSSRSTLNSPPSVEYSVADSRKLKDGRPKNPLMHVVMKTNKTSLQAKNLPRPTFSSLPSDKHSVDLERELKNIQLRNLFIDDVMKID